MPNGMFPVDYFGSVMNCRGPYLQTSDQSQQTRHWGDIGYQQSQRGRSMFDMIDMRGQIRFNLKTRMKMNKKSTTRWWQYTFMLVNLIIITLRIQMDDNWYHYHVHMLLKMIMKMTEAIVMKMKMTIKICEWYYFSWWQRSWQGQ